MSGRVGVSVLLLALSGCMHVPLRNHTANQARSVSDLYQQEVLNNLAMFAYDPYSLPHFSYANQGAASITDQAGAAFTPSWSRITGFAPFPLLFNASGNLSAQRQALESFTMTPVNDPRKLELMRCAYQKALAGCQMAQPSTTCPDCATRFKVFYTGSPDGDVRAAAKGIVTSECIGRRCWFRIGCKKCLPHGCPCHLMSHYEGVYVWVVPGGQDELTKLTLAILDFAQHDPPLQAQKQVLYYVDERGIPTTSDTAVGVVSASVGVTERNESLLNLPRGDELALRDSLESDLDAINAEIDDAQVRNRVSTLNDLFDRRRLIQQKLNYLNQQLRVGGLREQYVPRVMPQTGALPPLQFNQTIQTLTPSGIGGVPAF